MCVRQVTQQVWDVFRLRVVTNPLKGEYEKSTSTEQQWLDDKPSQQDQGSGTRRSQNVLCSPRAILLLFQD